MYFFPDTSQQAAVQMKAGIAYLESHGVKFGRMWLDIERFAWGTNLTANTAFVRELADTATGAGYSVGIYSGRHSWPAITGDSHAFTEYPLWYAHYEQPPNPSFSDYFQEGPYGGWTTPSMKQYSGSATACSVTLDLDWRPAPLQ